MFSFFPFGLTDFDLICSLGTLFQKNVLRHFLFKNQREKEFFFFEIQIMTKSDGSLKEDIFCGDDDGVGFVASFPLFLFRRSMEYIICHDFNIIFV